MPAVHVTAIFSPAPGKEARIQELIEAVVQSTTDNEPNCSTYFLTKAVDSTDFIVTETYNSMADFDYHKDQQKFKEFAHALEAESLTSKPSVIIASEKIAGFESR